MVIIGTISLHPEKPYISVSAYIDQISNAEQSSQSRVQSLQQESASLRSKTEEQAGTLHDLISNNLQLKKDLAVAEATVAQQAECVGQRKQEYNCLMQQVGKLRAQLASPSPAPTTVYGSPQVWELLTTRKNELCGSAERLRGITTSLKRACHTIQYDFEKLDKEGIPATPSSKSHIINIRGALNFSVARFDEAMQVVDDTINQCKQLTDGTSMMPQTVGVTSRDQQPVNAYGVSMGLSPTLGMYPSQSVNNVLSPQGPVFLPGQVVMPKPFIPAHTMFPNMQLTRDMASTEATKRSGSSVPHDDKRERTG